jgi:antitoxin Xre/MbcA/ParS-like protein
MPATTTPVRSKTAGALRAFFRIGDAWGLDRGQRATLLASSPRSIDRWKSDAASAELTRDQVERVSYVLGIYGGLHAILGESPFADEWVRRPNGDFGDTPPLDRMLAGNVGDLAFVRSYIDAWRVGW